MGWHYRFFRVVWWSTVTSTKTSSTMPVWRLSISITMMTWWHRPSQHKMKHNPLPHKQYESLLRSTISNHNHHHYSSPSSSASSHFKHRANGSVRTGNAAKFSKHTRDTCYTKSTSINPRTMPSKWWHSHHHHSPQHLHQPTQPPSLTPHHTMQVS